MRLRHLLVGIEVGAAVVLLAAAALLIQSAARLLNVDPGFRTDRSIAFQMGLPAAPTRMRRARVRAIDAIVERLARCRVSSLPRRRAIAPDGVDASDTAIRR